MVAMTILIILVQRDFLDHPTLNWKMLLECLLQTSAAPYSPAGGTHTLSMVLHACLGAPWGHVCIPSGQYNLGTYYMFLKQMRFSYHQIFQQMHRVGFRVCFGRYHLKLWNAFPSFYTCISRKCSANDSTDTAVVSYKCHERCVPEEGDRLN